MSLILVAAAAAQAAAAPAPGPEARKPHEVIMPADARNREFFERYGFSEAVIDGNRVYLSGVVEMTTFHTDLPKQIDAFAAVKKRYVRAPFPAWTAIDVDRLLPDHGLVEIKIVARRARAAGRQK